MTPALDLTPEQVRKILQNLHKLPESQQSQVLRDIDELTERKKAKKRRESLLDFVMHVDKNYKIGAHHKHLAKLLEDMAFGRKDRVTVSMPPRFGKSQLTSVYFPAWYIGNFPDRQIMMVTHTADLSVDFGRKVRNIVDSDAFRAVFPDVTLASDSKSAGRWNTSQGGVYYAAGVGGAIAGRGAHFLCISRDAIVVTRERGRVPAGSVQPGEHVWAFSGFSVVQRRFVNYADALVRVDGVVMTPNHPVWTFDAGWVESGALTTRSLLHTITVWSYIRLYSEILYGQARKAWIKLFSGLQCVGTDASEVQQPERGQLSVVRRTWYKVLRRVETLCCIFGRHGLSPIRDGQTGPRGFRRGLLQIKLSLGGRRHASTEPAQQCDADRVREDTVHVSLGRGNGNDGGSGAPQSPTTGDAPGSRTHGGTDELGAAPRSTDEFGWLQRAGVFFVSRGFKTLGGGEGFVMGGFEALIASRVFGLLVGVRRVKTLDLTPVSSTEVVNFQVADSNTYYVGGLITHNCIDDAVNEQDILNGNMDVLDKAYDWYAYGARTRLMPNGCVAIVGTRWAQNDLIGRVVQDMVRNPDSDQWEVVEFPAIFEKTGADGDTTTASLWPEQWSVESLLRTKASMPPFQWSAQYMQMPTSAEAAIIKREWWQPWENEAPPACDYIIMSLDAAAEKTTRSDFTALTTWGVFTRDGEDGYPVNHIILLNSIKERWEFPTLKRRAYEEYDEWKPDWFVVEKKSAGTQLYQEMRAAGVPVQEFTPHRGSGDKTARLNSVSDIFASGMVWYPAGRRWAEEVVDEVCGFPAMPNDDLCDSTVMALMRFRNGGFIQLPGDRWDDAPYRGRKAAYY